MSTFLDWFLDPSVAFALGSACGLSLMFWIWDDE